MKRNKKRKGFTLLEVVVVLGIMSMVIAISVPNYIDILRDSAVKTDLISAKNINKAIRELRISLENQEYPNSYLNAGDIIEIKFKDLENTLNDPTIFLNNRELNLHNSYDKKMYVLLINTEIPNYKGEKNERKELGYKIVLEPYYNQTITYLKGEKIKRMQ